MLLANTGDISNFSNLANLDILKRNCWLLSFFLLEFCCFFVAVSSLDTLFLMFYSFPFLSAYPFLLMGWFVLFEGSSNITTNRTPLCAVFRFAAQGSKMRPLSTALVPRDGSTRGPRLETLSWQGHKGTRAAITLKSHHSSREQQSRVKRGGGEYRGVEGGAGLVTFAKLMWNANKCAAVGLFEMKHFGWWWWWWWWGWGQFFETAQMIEKTNAALYLCLKEIQGSHCHLSSWFVNTRGF